MASWAGPLSGIKVLDLTRVLAGPFATQMLGDLGAEIIKIEPPDGGDVTRSFAPFREGESHYFLSINRQKKSVVIDLRKPAGADLIRQLALGADILIENFRPGVMAGLSLDYEPLARANPRLIYCSISGFGQSGPLRSSPSFDLVTQALTGAMSINGDEETGATKIGIPLGDMVGGCFAPAAILAAVYERERTGTGRLIDVSLYDGMLGMLAYYPQLAWFNGKDPTPVGTRHVGIVPYGAFPAKDGEVVIACLTNSFWLNLCRALALPHLASDDRFDSMPRRLANRIELETILSNRTRAFGTQELRALLDEHDVPNAPVLGITDALKHPHALARNMVVTVDHATLGAIPVVGRPVKFPGAEQPPLSAPPILGEHTESVLRAELHLQDAQLEQLRIDKVIA